jgi:hypothetical protein
MHSHNWPTRASFVPSTTLEADAESADMQSVTKREADRAAKAAKAVKATGGDGLSWQQRQRLIRERRESVRRLSVQRETVAKALAEEDRSPSPVGRLAALQEVSPRIYPWHRTSPSVPVWRQGPTPPLYPGRNQCKLSYSRQALSPNKEVPMVRPHSVCETVVDHEWDRTLPPLQLGYRIPPLAASCPTDASAVASKPDAATWAAAPPRLTSSASLPMLLSPPRATSPNTKSTGRLVAMAELYGVEDPSRT